MAIINNINSNDNDTKIKKLNHALENLYEDYCESKYDDGYNQKDETLEEIKDLINELENSNNDPNNNQI